MKKMRLLFTLSIIAAFASLSFGQIAGTAHDLSGATWNTEGEICIVCHTPHNGDLTVAEAPLWNHELTVVGAYGIYSGSTMDAVVGQPSAESRLCLSCHDGTVGLENYGGTTGGTTYIIGAAGNVGTDLSDDHPISITYDAALATTDGELHDPTTTAALGGFITTEMLFNNQVQCASCHDVHGTGIASLLRIDNSGSLLCLTCHDK